MGELFEAARRGDRTSQMEITRLVERFSQALCRGGGPPGAPDLEWKDVAQEASRKVFAAGLEQYRGQGTERSYLYAIVKSTMIQMARAASRRRRHEQNAAPADLLPPHDPIPKLQVSRILALLSAECRDLIARVFLDGQPYGELAREMGLVESSVRAKVSRCIQRARSVAAEAGVE